MKAKADQSAGGDEAGDAGEKQSGEEAKVEGDEDAEERSSIRVGGFQLR